MDEPNKNIESDKVENVPFIPGSNTKQDISMKFGWGKFRPKCLQFLNDPRWFLVVIIAYTVFQATCIMGLTNVTLPSIEKRFSMTAKELGLIAAANDVIALVIVVFISFYGDYGNKIKWIGGGGILLGFGALLYALPHVLVGTYKPGGLGPNGGLCTHKSENLIEDNQMNCDMESDSQWYYTAIFFMAQIVMGAGIAPFYSLVPAYFDENVHPKSMPIYLGIWYCSVFVGPGAGLAVAGKFLSLYVDITQPAGVNLTANDPRFIGAWWLGFVVFGLLILVSSLFVLGFPQEMPGAHEIRQEHMKKGNLRKATYANSPSLKQILPELIKLLTNWTFIFNTFGLVGTLLFVGAFMPFFPKLLLLKFGLNPEETGYAIAAMTTPGMSVGIVLGSFIVRKFPLKKVCKYSALLLLILRILGIILPLSFLIHGCENINMAGMDTPYGNLVTRNTSHLKDISPEQNSLLKSSCNSRCRCSLSRLAPVCGSDNLTYFDVCHAGCTSKLPNKMFGNCSCISSKTADGGNKLGTAKHGYCDRQCQNFLLFAIIVAINALIQFVKIVPNKTVILRCVPDNKRAFATGVQYLFIKTLGLLPGPIIFGHVVDSSCKLWQNTCGKRGRCFVYDIDMLSRAVLMFGVATNIASTLFYFFSWYLCETGDNCEEMNDNCEEKVHSQRNSTSDCKELTKCCYETNL